MKEGVGLVTRAIQRIFMNHEDFITCEDHCVAQTRPHVFPEVLIRRGPAVPPEPARRIFDGRKDGLLLVVRGPSPELYFVRSSLNSVTKF